jgi:hypothetical protein
VALPHHAERPPLLPSPTISVLEGEEHPSLRQLRHVVTAVDTDAEDVEEVAVSRSL